jgi:hypothetical protein
MVSSVSVRKRSLFRYGFSRRLMVVYLVLVIGLAHRLRVLFGAAALVGSLIRRLRHPRGVPGLSAVAV